MANLKAGRMGNRGEAGMPNAFAGSMAAAIDTDPWLAATVTELSLSGPWRWQVALSRAYLVVALTFIVASVAYADILRGTDGSETIIGTGGSDVIYGLGAYDVLEGKRGSDELHGGAGRDEVYGGQGRDTVYGGRGRDQLGGDSGGDTIKAVDGQHDFILCGAGFDVAWIDEHDAAQMCEIVNDKEF